MKEYYYFSNEDKTLGFRDNRKIKLGITHKVECEPKLYKQGLHASKRIINSLEYSPGPIIWKVTLGGKVIHDKEKSCATERTYVAGGINVSETLRAFAHKCALDVIQWLKTGEDTLRASAPESARESLQAYAKASLSASDWEFALISARASAWALACSSTCLSTFASAWVSARATQNRRLAQMVSKAMIKEV